MTDTADFLPAGQLRRLGSLCYDFILLAALVVVAGGVFQPLFSFYGKLPWLDLLYQVYLLTVVFGYFAYCWIRSGQTLAMKTWKLRLTDARDGGRLRWSQAVVRFVVTALFSAPVLPAWSWAHFNPSQRWIAIAVTAWACVPLLWSLFDRDRRFLQDRLAGTRIIRC